MRSERFITSIKDDWYEGKLPENIEIAGSAYIETSYSFLRFRSRRKPGLTVGEGAALYAPVLDVGAEGWIEIGARALISSARLISDTEMIIGEMTMIAWGAVVMDCRRGCGRARPVTIGRNVWIGFEACILPGVTIGEGSVVGARAVVHENLPPFSVAVGNPARVVRQLPAR
jgi:carbonic anhydrase/acetyltransferase-like protein (isoleucine patch superfamily)